MYETPEETGERITAVLEKAIAENPEVQAVFEELMEGVHTNSMREHQAAGNDPLFYEGERVDVPWAALSKEMRQGAIGQGMWTAVAQLAISHLVHIEPELIEGLVHYINASLAAHQHGEQH